MLSIVRRLWNLFVNRAQILDSFVSNFLQFLPDKLYLSLRYRCKMGYWLNWTDTRTFSEKIQWLKIYDRKAEYTRMVDKYAVKKYVADLIGEKYIIPTLGVWDKIDNIDWDSLPESFVLKTTQGGGGGGVIICRSKGQVNKAEVKRILNESMKLDLYSKFREWPYKNVRPRIIAEQYITVSKFDDNGDLPDYKFFCFNGQPIYCQVIRGRFGDETIDFYDMEWNHQDFIGLNPLVQNGSSPVECPKHLKEMQLICQKLSKGIPFVRVDLYVTSDSVYFGEMTFYPYSGFGTFRPEIWQKKLGDLIELWEISDSN